MHESNKVAAKSNDPSKSASAAVSLAVFVPWLQRLTSLLFPWWCRWQFASPFSRFVHLCFTVRCTHACFPSTLQAMLVNSADLMGGSSEPDGLRGFGRVRLEGGLPLGAEGDLALFVADAFETEIGERTIHEYEFVLLPNTGLELRASLSWLDPPVSADASQQMLNDLDLTLVAPDGNTLYRMWSDGADVKNVIERVIISSSDATGGMWTVAVSCLDLTTETQPYSLVVTGPIDTDSGGFSQREATGAAMDRAAPSVLALCVSALAMLVGVLAVLMP